MSLADDSTAGDPTADGSTASASAPHWSNSGVLPSSVGASLLAADALLAIPFMLVTFLTALPAIGITEAGLRDPEGFLEWLVLMVPSTALIFRRRFPVSAVLIGAAATTTIWLVGMPDYIFATAIHIYSVFLHGRPPIGRRVAVGIALFLTLFTLTGVIAGEAPAFSVLVVALMTGMAIAIASNVSTQRSYLAEVERRAEQSEQLRVAEIRRVAIDERSRIARELHDVVAHGLSVIVVQAGAAQRIIDTNTEGTKHALGEIENAARTSLGEMRQVLGVLRTDDTDNRRPTPDVRSLAELIASYGDHGVDTSLILDGTARQLPSTVDTSVYRIVEEALTNVLKHAGPRPTATVTLSYETDQLAVSIVDNGRGAAAKREPGHGLIGMRERVDVLGGTFQAKPVVGGGFGVKVEIPLEPALQP